MAFPVVMPDVVLRMSPTPFCSATTSSTTRPDTMPTRIPSLQLRTVRFRMVTFVMGVPGGPVALMPIEPFASVPVMPWPMPSKTTSELVIRTPIDESEDRSWSKVYSPGSLMTRAGESVTACAPTASRQSASSRTAAGARAHGRLRTDDVWCMISSRPLRSGAVVVLSCPARRTGMAPGPEAIKEGLSLHARLSQIRS